MHEDILLSNERIDQLYSSKIKIIQSSEVFFFFNRCCFIG